MDLLPHIITQLYDLSKCRGSKKDLNPKTANNSRRFGFRVMLQWFDPDCFNWLIAARWYMSGLYAIFQGNQAGTVELA